MSDPIRVERHGPVTTVILKPARGPPAMRSTAQTRLPDCSRRSRSSDRDDNRIRSRCCGAITELSFFAPGADLKAFPARRTPNAVHRDRPPAPMGPTRMMLSKNRWIAAVSGYAVAGGLELALWCDLRVAEEDGRVRGVSAVGGGVPLIDGGTIRLPRLDRAEGRAMDMILTGRCGRRPPKALAIGLANRGCAQRASGVASRRRSWPPSWPRWPQQCMRSGSAYRRCISGGYPKTESRWTTNSPASPG